MADIQNPPTAQTSMVSQGGSPQVAWWQFFIHLVSVIRAQDAQLAQQSADIVDLQERVDALENP